jgi:acetyl esterase/lipase
MSTSRRYRIRPPSRQPKPCLVYYKDNPPAIGARQNGLWSEEVSGFARSAIADKITPYEPIPNVTPDWPPTLLIHGTQDTDVPYEQSELMAKKFKQKGVHFTLIPIDHGEHGLEGGDPQKITEAYKTMAKFIKEHLNSGRR